jgi:hypothetical protein
MDESEAALMTSACAAKFKRESFQGQVIGFPKNLDIGLQCYPRRDESRSAIAHQINRQRSLIGAIISRLGGELY